MKTTKLIFSLFILLHNGIFAADAIKNIKKERSLKKKVLTSGTIYLNLDQAVPGPGYVDIPVSFASPDNIVSLDFALKFNESVLSFQKIVNPVSYIDPLANYDPGDKTLRFASSSFLGEYYQVNTTIVSLRFHVLAGTIHNSDFFSLKGYLNGDVVSMQAVGDILSNYVIGTISGPCTDPSFCMPIIAMDSVKDIIGYDLILNYDNTKVQPTGTIIVKNSLINPSYVSYVVNNEAANGVINISVFLNATAPVTASFKGIGELLCVEFTKNASLPAVDTILFAVSYLQESYANGVSSELVDAGSYTNTKSKQYSGRLEFWTDNSPIKYDASNPGQYLISNIYGTDSNCANKSGTAVQPDLNGHFSYNILNGTAVQVERDILAVTDVQPVINGFDASLAHKVVVSDVSFIPTIYQIIALDVNTDGVISSGDISQINQRSVKTIPEFKQKWNYNNNGSSNGQLSKDWLFVDSSLLSTPAYQKSLSYPASDGLGYSKYNVPVVPFCLPIPVSYDTICPVSKCTPYTGVLLGDVDGNYDSIPADGQIKKIINATSAGIIYLNLDQATVGAGYIDVPVSFTSPEKIVSLDFALKFNENTILYDKVAVGNSHLSDAMANYAHDDKTLRFTSNGNIAYAQNKPIVSIRFLTLADAFRNFDFHEMTGYLNGKIVRMEVKGMIATAITSTSKTNVQIYPNPAGHVINVIAPERADIELIDLEGKQLIIHARANANEKQEINTTNIANGTYLLKIYTDHFVSTQRIVIKN